MTKAIAKPALSHEDFERLYRFGDNPISEALEKMRPWIPRNKFAEIERATDVVRYAQLRLTLVRLQVPENEENLTEAGYCNFIRDQDISWFIDAAPMTFPKIEGTELEILPRPPGMEDGLQ